MQTTDKKSIHKMSKAVQKANRLEREGKRQGHLRCGAWRLSEVQESSHWSKLMGCKVNVTSLTWMCSLGLGEDLNNIVDIQMSQVFVNCEVSFTLGVFFLTSILKFWMQNEI